MTSRATAKEARDPERHDRGRRSIFVYELDGETYEHDRPKITGAEIMEQAGITEAEGLIQLLPDGTTATIDPDEVVKLVPKPQFKRRPKFKRG